MFIVSVIVWTLLLETRKWSCALWEPSLITSPAPPSWREEKPLCCSEHHTAQISIWVSVRTLHGLCPLLCRAPSHELRAWPTAGGGCCVSICGRMKARSNLKTGWFKPAFHFLWTVLFSFFSFKCSCIFFFSYT